jgi:hypothetical protein
MCFVQSGSRTIAAPTVMNPADSTMITLMAALSCRDHGGKHCWKPGSVDAPIIERYHLSGEAHIPVVDSEIAKWVDEMVSNII